jgi:hypothetical protein
LSLAFAPLATELEEVFGSAFDEGPGEDRFEQLALRAFEFQFARNETYGRFCRARGVTPASVDGWRSIPAVPTSAFKSLPIVAGTTDDVERVFRTSGTTGGAGSTGEHHVRSLSLYEASAIPNFRRYLLPDGVRPRMIALLPSPEEAPESSLSHMAGLVGDRLCDSKAFVFHPQTGLDTHGLRALLENARSVDEPVLLMGTAFALVHWLDHLASSSTRLTLPAGSRVMETGGFKGRSREVSREALYAAISSVHGLERSSIVNEYGMTEMLSQFYEPVLLDPRMREGTLEERRHVPPPWVRTRVLDPATLEACEAGEVGVLCHFDLANLGSVCALLTEDLGRADRVGFELLGRVQGSSPRGCSLAVEDFLRAQATGV